MQRRPMATSRPSSSCGVKASKQEDELLSQINHPKAQTTMPITYIGVGEGGAPEEERGGGQQRQRAELEHAACKGSGGMCAMIG